MDQKDKLLEPSVNDFEILVSRKAGKHEVRFVGFPMPQDVHEAQRSITLHYQAQRSKIAEGFNKSKLQHKQMQAEAVVATRVLNAAKAQLSQEKTKGNQNDDSTK